MSLKGNRAAVDLLEKGRSRFVMACWGMEQKRRGSSLRRLEPRRFCSMPQHAITKRDRPFSNRSTAARFPLRLMHIHPQTRLEQGFYHRTRCLRIRFNVVIPRCS